MPLEDKDGATSAQRIFPTRTQSQQCSYVRKITEHVAELYSFDMSYLANNWREKSSKNLNAPFFYNMEGSTYKDNEKPTSQKDDQTPKRTIRTMPEFAKALREDMALQRDSVNVPESWSMRPENLTVDLVGYAVEPLSSHDSATNSTPNQSESWRTIDLPTVSPNETEVDWKRINTRTGLSPTIHDPGRLGASFAGVRYRSTGVDQTTRWWRMSFLWSLNNNPEAFAKVNQVLAASLVNGRELLGIHLLLCFLHLHHPRIGDHAIGREQMSSKNLAREHQKLQRQEFLHMSSRSSQSPRAASPARGPDRFGAHIPKATPSPHVQTKRFETTYGLGSSSSAFIDAEDVVQHTRRLLSLQLLPGDTVYYERKGDEQQILILVLRPRRKNPVYPQHYQRKRQIGDGYFVKQHLLVSEDGIVLHLPIQIVGCCEEHDHRPSVEPGQQFDELAVRESGYPSKLTAREKFGGVLADFLRRAKPSALRFQKFVDRIDEGDEEALKEAEERYNARLEKLEKQKIWRQYQVYARKHSAGDQFPDLEDLFPTPKVPRQPAIDLNKPLPALPIDQESRHDSRTTSHPNNLVSTMLFFLYSFLACPVYGLLTGTIGFLTAYAFMPQQQRQHRNEGTKHPLHRFTIILLIQSLQTHDLGMEAFFPGRSNQGLLLLAFSCSCVCREAFLTSDPFMGGREGFGITGAAAKTTNHQYHFLVIYLLEPYTAF
ncbi:uncharacterized protein MYCFIDRAFT_174615 [Pseudocercospora fijiensis CIRAD86]|uniref:Uncharacterized protein n=1 Tax=Pseudocercospora fijiensis (strain CIRAD86) TaxID=383855 RepID=M3B139_PSEFD|nr:uncharacterized protein MYCFIDRAFT_174615 [Pseudocercospora fijiensis CIRAD86]EME83142.1 hypothetical protein MYCFIDRAFT_174615 [Pseudocercospora fijiensis CIRAD86]